MKPCLKCGIVKPISQYKTEKRGTRNVCNSCRNHHLRIAARGRLNWLTEGKKIPDACECCGKFTDKLVYDHNHITESFRGWICQQCNQGLGLLGDDVSSIKKALTYLINSELK